jgi:hypothetical protein
MNGVAVNKVPEEVDSIYIPLYTFFTAKDILRNN